MNNDVLKKKIGIIGGGQLGKMMILEAKKLGFYVITLDPSHDCPSHSISDEHIIADFNDKEAIISLANKTDVITYEFEHIDSEILISLEEKGHKVYPTGTSLRNIQNKYIQKTILKENSVEVPYFERINSTVDMQNFGIKNGFPYLLKACTGGYDGKGNIVVKNSEHINECYEALGSGKIELMAEKFVDFTMEISVLACRGTDGYISVFPVAQNMHIDNILYQTIVPANITQKETAQAMEIANSVMNIFQGVGMFCVEMFLCHSGEILVNEVAPRPHNSGHYTIEGCFVSQFQQHIRAIVGLPLGDSSLLVPSVMMNLLGEEGFKGPVYVKGLDKALAIPGVNVHIYGKSQTAPNRKMGHITVTDFDINSAIDKSVLAKKQIKIINY